MIDLSLLVTSMFLTLTGAALDNYTTRIFMKDLGIEFEANKWVRKLVRKYGYKGVLPQEATIVTVFGIIDSSKLFTPFIFFGLMFFIARGLTATDNLTKIVEYRAIGIDAFKEKRESHKKAFQNISLMNKMKYILPYLIETLICLVIYGMLIFVDFPPAILGRYFVIGLVSYLISTAYYS